MYKLMFADDEALIRKNIEKMIPWETLGFKFISSCQNGHELLEAIELEVPDVVITDIEMPFVNGIEVAKRLNQLDPDIKIIFLTGYSDFEYAKKAIEYGVSDYILKPITVEGISKVLVEMKETLDDERERKHDISSLLDFYEENRETIQNMFLKKLLSEELESSFIKDRMQRLELERLEGDRFLVAVLMLDQVDPSSIWNDSKDIMNFMAYNIVTELLDNKKIGYAIAGEQFIHIILSNKNCLNQEDSKAEFIQILEDIRYCVHRALKIPITIGIGRVSHDIGTIAISNEEAIAAVGYSNIIEHEGLIFSKDIEPKRNRSQLFDWSYEKKLLQAIKLGNSSYLQETYEGFVKALKKEAYPVEQARIIVMTAIFNLIKEGGHIGLDLLELIGKAELKELTESLDYKQICEHLYRVCKKMLKVLSDNREERYSDITYQALSIIQSEYQNPDLSLDMVVDQLHLSQSYLRAIFKKETNTTLGNYITKVRMEKGYDLILRTNKKIYEVAEETGYTDSHYFSYCFKKYHNCTPQELRNGKES